MSLSKHAVEQPPRGAGTEEALPRLLVIGDALMPLARAAAERWDARAELVSVPSFLSALGELGVRSADAVIGDVRSMAGMEASVVSSLRSLAPQAKLIVLASPDRSAALKAAGCDTVLGYAADAGAIAAMLGGEADVTPVNEAVTHGAVREVAVTEPLGVAETAAAPAAHGDRDMAGDEIGDIDLINAVMGEAEDVCELALRLIACRSGIQLVDWSIAKSAVPAGHVSVSVKHGNQGYGVLHAPAPCTDDELTPWADWIGHWLAMDRRVNHLQELAMRDELTGVWNRRYFTRFLESALQRATSERQQLTVLLFDIDDFKDYNDRYGHPIGDEILRETAKLMQSMVREHDVVARIGGDEFAVVFWDAESTRREGRQQHPHDVITIARRFQQAVCEHRFPKLVEVKGTLTISGGLAGFPWDGRSAAELVDRADQMALESKRQGKNVITIGEGALRNGTGLQAR